MDNGSTDGSLELVGKKYQEVEILPLPENLGFCRAVNEGIRKAEAAYVILLNNDTQVFPEFVEQLYLQIRAHERAFSAGAMMIQAHNPGKLDAAGDYYSALAGLTPGERANRRRNTAGPAKFLPYAPAPPSIGRKY